jgi:hypothetical protein
MSNRNKIILLYTLVFLIFAIPYVIHLVKLASVATSISLKEAEQDRLFESSKQKVQLAFDKMYPNDKFVFDDLFQISKATTNYDTIVSFFIYSNKLNIRKIDFEYINCIKLKSNSEATKNIADRKFDLAIEKLENEYGNLVNNLVSKIDRNKFFIDIPTEYCSKYFENDLAYKFNPFAINEFRRLLNEYSLNKKNIEEKNKIIYKLYEDRLNQFKVDLNVKDQKLLDKYLSTSTPILNDYQRFNFKSDRLGNFDYSIPANIIDEERLIEAINKINDEHYKNYSLNNGAMPYAYCYGSANFGQSKITINAGNEDVIVTIKNLKNIVVRHVYVKSNRSFTLNVQNGRYNVFFYYGDGWNPKRIMPKTICGNLIGGFVNNEFTNKDPEIVDLFYSNLVYTLQIQSNGNFQTESCSKDAAF